MGKSDRTDFKLSFRSEIRNKCREQAPCRDDWCDMPNPDHSRKFTTQDLVLTQAWVTTPRAPPSGKYLPTAENDKRSIGRSASCSSQCSTRPGSRHSDSSDSETSPDRRRVARRRGDSSSSVPPGRSPP